MLKMEDVLRAMVHDAMTLTDAQVDASFNSSRKSMEHIREEKGLEPYTEEDWKFIRNFYELFYRAGFSDAARRFKNLLDQIADGRQAEEVKVMCMTSKTMS